MLPHPTAFNPFATSDPKLTRMPAKANAAPAQHRRALYQDAMRYVVDRAWFVSVLRMDGLFAFNGKKPAGFTAAPSHMPDLAWAVTRK